MTSKPNGEAKKGCGGLSYEDCRKATERLDDYLDRELTSSERVRLEHHLRLCDHCTEEYDLRSKAQEILRAKLCGEKCPDKLKASISAMLHEECGPG